MTAKARLARTVKNLAATADRVRGPGRASSSSSTTGSAAARVSRSTCPPTLFAAQMELARGSGRVVTLDDALAALAAPSAPPGRDPVVVTFDDGTADFVEHALPILERHGVPATLYVATAFVEDQQPFPVRRAAAVVGRARATPCPPGS